MRSYLAPSLALAAGCTQWTTVATYGDPTEVGRRLVGAPQVEESSSSQVEGGFGTFGESVHGRHHDAGFQVGSMSGSHESVRRTHCVQQAQIDYVQPVTYEAQVSRRAIDVGGAITLAVAGIALAGVAAAIYNSQESVYETDPSFFAKPASPAWAYGVGGAAIAGAAAWLVYSFAALPKGPAPVTPPTRRAWTETTYVEGTGCGLVPGDR
jgi:hypothetical protein